MATIKKIKRKRGGVAFQIGYYWQGERRWLSLPSFFSRGDAEELARIVEKILDAKKAEREPDRRTAGWLELAPKIILDKLEALDLIQTARKTTLGELIEEYRAEELPTLKESTQMNKEQSIRRAFEFFPASTVVASITRVDVERFAQFLRSTGAQASAASVLKDVKRIGNWGAAAGLIETNPFEGLTVGSFKNKAREYYVDAETYRKLLDACEDQRFRTLLALYRIGGLRRGEALALDWENVDWKRGRLTVYSPKTERHAGKDRRDVPLFPELREELERLYRGEKSGPMFPGSFTISYEFAKIAKRAGVDLWARFFQNLRSSRAIEIARDFGAVAESEWLGHETNVARDHYLHAIEADFQSATTKTTTI